MGEILKPDFKNKPQTNKVNTRLCEVLSFNDFKQKKYLEDLKKESLKEYIDNGASLDEVFLKGIIFKLKEGEIDLNYIKKLNKDVSFRLGIFEDEYLSIKDEFIQLMIVCLDMIILKSKTFDELMILYKILFDICPKRLYFGEPLLEIYLQETNKPLKILSKKIKQDNPESIENYNNNYKNVLKKLKSNIQQRIIAINADIFEWKICKENIKGDNTKAFITKYIKLTQQKTIKMKLRSIF